MIKYGVSGIEIEWSRSYLRDRRQYCSINGQKSEIRDVRCGIPQGLCLGPLLFIVFLNDFEGFLDYSKANMYADDTHTTVAASDREDLISVTKEEPSNISHWLRVNKLIPNSSKTEYTVIGHSRKLNELGTLPSLE